MLDFLKNMFHKAKKGEMPVNMDNVGQLQDKAQDMVAQHADTINNVADTIQEKIPGEMDDKVIDSAQDKMNDFANKPQ